MTLEFLMGGVVLFIFACFVLALGLSRREERNSILKLKGNFVVDESDPEKSWLTYRVTSMIKTIVIYISQEEVLRHPDTPQTLDFRRIVSRCIVKDFNNSKVLALWSEIAEYCVKPDSVITGSLDHLSYTEQRIFFSMSPFKFDFDNEV